MGGVDLFVIHTNIYIYDVPNIQPMCGEAFPVMDSISSAGSSSYGTYRFIPFFWHYSEVSAIYNLFAFTL